MKLKNKCTGCGKPLHTHNCTFNVDWHGRFAKLDAKDYGFRGIMVTHICGSSQIVFNAKGKAAMEKVGIKS